MSSSLVTPLLIYRPFGAAAANPTYIKLPIPDADQTGITVNAASFATGFPPNTMTPEASGGLPFFGQDLNGILWMVTAYCANFAAGAMSEFNSTLAGDITGYPLGCVLRNTNGDGLWINQVEGNSTNPDAGGAGWLPAAGVGKSAVVLSNTDVTLSALQAALPLITLSGSLSGNVNVIFPANTGQQWVVSNTCTGAFTVTAKVAGQTGVVIPATGAGAPTSVYCNGTDIFNTGVSTAGLAPINSPALTGTPTAPTASPATSSTTQIATTAFVQAAIAAALTPYAQLASPIFSGSPTVPTAADLDNSLRIANTAWVNRAIGEATLTQVRGSTFTCIAGTQSVTFAVPFPTACDAVTVTGEYTGWNLGNIVTRTRFGFTYLNSNSGRMSYVAVGH